MCLMFRFTDCFTAESIVVCYQCVSTHPGCGDNFKWLWYKTIICPEEDDICVKITERIGGNNYSFTIVIVLFVCT